jgi:hypothetical protein
LGGTLGDVPDAEPPPDAGPDAEPPRDAEPDAEVPDAELPDADLPDADLPDAELPDADFPDAQAPSDSGTGPGPDPDPDPDPGPEPCVPSTEVCNGADDDCDGVVDEVPAEACQGGGFRYCIAGTMSECPRRCEVCVPGGVRVCQNSYCTFWGEQECAGDGQGFGSCRERRVPPECDATARKHQSSPELEQCCLDNGYCCLDMHDLDGDGNRSEMLGNCSQVRCD